MAPVIFEEKRFADCLTLTTEYYYNSIICTRGKGFLQKMQMKPEATLYILKFTKNQQSLRLFNYVADSFRTTLAEDAY